MSGDGGVGGYVMTCLLIGDCAWGKVIRRKGVSLVEDV